MVVFVETWGMSEEQLVVLEAGDGRIAPVQPYMLMPALSIEHCAQSCSDVAPQSGSSEPSSPQSRQSLKGLHYIATMQPPPSQLSCAPGLNF